MDKSTTERIDGLLRELTDLASSVELQEGWHLEASLRKRLQEIVDEILASGNPETRAQAVAWFWSALSRKGRPMDG